MRDADFFRRWMTAAAAAVEREADRLTELDSPIGDADHGSNLLRGFTAVRAALSAEDQAAATPGAVLQLAGRTLISTVGGASGPLYGTLLRRTGKELGEAAEVSDEALREALYAGVGAVAQLGGAAPGDKTMLDALVPGVAALSTSYRAAGDAAEHGALATVPLRARKGRASYLGERSIGHQDPGATSSALLLVALADVVDDLGVTTPAPGAGPASVETEHGLVGIVLVSHSESVAESVAELARGLAAGGPMAPVAAAGGTADGGLGTSAERILAAAREVDRGAGVALLADLGSSVLTVKSLLAEGELPPGPAWWTRRSWRARWRRWWPPPPAPPCRRSNRPPARRTSTARRRESAAAEGFDLPALALRRAAGTAVADAHHRGLDGGRRRRALVDQALGGDRSAHPLGHGPADHDDALPPRVEEPYLIARAHGLRRFGALPVDLHVARPAGGRRRRAGLRQAHGPDPRVHPHGSHVRSRSGSRCLISHAPTLARRARNDRRTFGGYHKGYGICHVDEPKPIANAPRVALPCRTCSPAAYRTAPVPAQGRPPTSPRSIHPCRRP